jgi:hypothetical protein
MTARLTSRLCGSGEAGVPRNLAPVTEHDDGGAGRPRRKAAERLLGAAAEPSAPRPQRVRPEAPRAVRWAALVVAVEAAAVLVGAVVLLYLTVTGNPDDMGRAVAEVVLVALLGAALAAGAAGLWRVALWARGPVVALQVLLGLLGYTAAFQASRPEFGVPALVLAALELYLLATPEARLAFYRRTDA